MEQQSCEKYQCQIILWIFFKKKKNGLPYNFITVSMFQLGYIKYTLIVKITGTMGLH